MKYVGKYPTRVKAIVSQKIGPRRSVRIRLNNGSLYQVTTKNIQPDYMPKTGMELSDVRKKLNLLRVC